MPVQNSLNFSQTPSAFTRAAAEYDGIEHGDHGEHGRVGAAAKTGEARMLFLFTSDASTARIATAQTCHFKIRELLHSTRLEEHQLGMHACSLEAGQTK